MLKLSNLLVILVLLSLWSGCHGTVRRRKSKEVPDACKNEGIRVSECRASFITDLEISGKFDRNSQRTNCTLYSKLECCMVTEYGVLGCSDKEIINKAISNAIKEYPSYENCPKGLCDPSTVNGSFKIMRDMDENLHGRDAVSRLTGTHKRKVKREVDPNQAPHAAETNSEASKSFMQEHFKGPKQKGKKKGHKRSHKAKKTKKPMLAADDLPKDLLVHNQTSEVVTAKAHEDGLPTPASVAPSGGHENEKSASSNASLPGKATDSLKKSSKNDAVNVSEIIAVPAQPASAAAQEKSGAAANASGQGNLTVPGNAKLGGAADLHIPISIEIVKNLTLSELGKVSRKIRRRRRHHRNKQGKYENNFNDTKALAGQNKTGVSDATLHNISAPNASHEPSPLPGGPSETAADRSTKAGFMEATGNDREKLEMKDDTGGASISSAAQGAGTSSTVGSIVDATKHSPAAVAASDSAKGDKSSDPSKSDSSTYELASAPNNHEKTSKYQVKETAPIDNKTSEAVAENTKHNLPKFDEAPGVPKEAAAENQNHTKASSHIPEVGRGINSGLSSLLRGSDIKLQNETNLDTKVEGDAKDETHLAKSAVDASSHPDAAHSADSKERSGNSSTENEEKSDDSGKVEEWKKSRLHDVPEISLAIHRLEKHGKSSTHKSERGRAGKEIANQSVSGGVHAGSANVSSHSGMVYSSVDEELSAPTKKVDNKTSAMGDVAINLKDPKQIFGSGPLIEVKGHKGRSVEKQMVHVYESGESVESAKGKSSLIDELLDQYGVGGSDYEFRYGREARRKHKQGFRDDDAPKVRRRQWDGDEPFEVDTTKDPFQEYPSVKDGDQRTGGLYVAERGRQPPADENVRLARHKKVHRRKSEKDYNYENVVRWKLLEELDSILDPKNSPEFETPRKHLDADIGREKDEDMDQWKRRLESVKVQVEAQSGNRMMGNDAFHPHDAEAMRDGEMYYRKYRRQGPLVYGQGFEGVERPVVKDPLIHQAKKRFWIERQESEATNQLALAPTERPTDVHLRPLFAAAGHQGPLGVELGDKREEKFFFNGTAAVVGETAAAEMNPRQMSENGPMSHLYGQGGRRLSNRRAARARRLMGSRASRRMHKGLKDTEGLKILRSDDLQADDDDDDDDDADDDDDDEDDEEKEAVATKKSTLIALVTQKGQVGRVDAAERPVMSFGEKMVTMPSTKPTPKKELKPAGNMVNSAESPDCVPDTLRAHTDYCRGIYTKHQLSIEEARRTASKKTMACYKLESIKGCLSAGSYFSKCVGSNNNEFQELQGSVMSQMRDLRCGASALSSSVLISLLTLAANFLLRRAY